MKKWGMTILAAALCVVGFVSTAVSSPGNQTIDESRLWFNQPARKSLTICGASQYDKSHYMDKGASDKYLGISTAMDGSGPVYFFDVAKLIALEGTNAHSDVDACIGYTSGISSVFTDNISAKGMSVSDVLGYAMTGRGNNNNPQCYAGYSLDGIVASNTTTFQLGATAFKFDENVAFHSDGLEFSLDGSCIYMNTYTSGQRNKLNRFTYDALDKTNNTLQLESTITTGAERVRSIDIYELGGREVLFYGEGDLEKATATKGTIWYRNISNNSWGTETVLTNDTAITGDIMGIKIAGVGYDKQYLHVYFDVGLRIYDLTFMSDGTLLVNFKKAFTGAELSALAGYPTGVTFGNFRNFEVSNNGEYAFLCRVPEPYAHALAVIHTPPPPPQQQHNVNQALVGDVTSTVTAENTAVEQGDSFTATYTANSGWISSVYTNGAPALDCSANPTTVTLTLDNITADINIVVATTEARPAAQPWYASPGLKVDFAQVGADAGDGCAGFHWRLDATDDFLAAPIHFQKKNSTLYSVKSLEAGESTAISTYQYDTLFGANVRGAAVSKPLNVHLVGSLSGNYILSLPLNTAEFAENVNAFQIWTSDNGGAPDAMCFTADGQYLYANSYSGSQSTIYKYRVLNGLKSSGTNLVLEASWSAGVRVRDMIVARLGDKDIVYINGNGTLYVLDTSDTANTAQSLNITFGGNYANLAVAGIGAGTPHLYVFGGDPASLNVYSINAADYSLTLFKSYSSTELGAICGYAQVGTSATGVGVAVTDDEATLFLGANATGVYAHLFVIRNMPYPDWLLDCGLEGEALAAMQDKYDTWAANQTGVDLTAGDYSAQFLMNADAEAEVALMIEGITLDANGNITLEIKGTAGAATIDLGQINGVLYLSTAEALDGQWTTRIFSFSVPANIGTDGIARPEIDDTNGNFFKAKVNFAAPADSTDLVAPDPAP